jgi:hypothetical protein
MYAGQTVKIGGEELLVMRERGHHRRAVTVMQ